MKENGMEGEGHGRHTVSLSWAGIMGDTDQTKEIQNTLSPGIGRIRSMSRKGEESFGN